MTRLRVVVLGYVVRCPLGGMAMHYLQYALGLARLGHDVYFIEDSDDNEECCYDPTRHVTGPDPTYGLSWATGVFNELGLGERWAYFDAHTTRWHGPCADRIDEICSGAEVVINPSGICPLRGPLIQIPVRVFIDTDPGFEQILQLTVPSRRARALDHTAFFTFGENVGRRECLVPDDGIRWLPTRQPIVLDLWAATPGIARAPFTTVMQWDSYPARELDGMRLGMKSESFGEFLELPRLSGDQRFEIALGSSNAPRELLLQKGWSLRDPLEVTHTPSTYRRFIEGSKAEFSVAKHGYVATHSGWFSERSAAYLASGRPVVLQNTGYSDWLPSGAGVLAFDDLAGAVEAVAEVGAHYEHHCRAAVDLAAEYFESGRVLNDLLSLATQSIPS